VLTVIRVLTPVTVLLIVRLSQTRLRSQGIARLHSNARFRTQAGAVVDPDAGTKLKSKARGRVVSTILMGSSLYMSVVKTPYRLVSSCPRVLANTS